MGLMDLIDKARELLGEGPGASTEARNGAKNGFSGDLPARPNATIRSPVAASMEHDRWRPTRPIKRLTH